MNSTIIKVVNGGISGNHLNRLAEEVIRLEDLTNAAWDRWHTAVEAHLGNGSPALPAEERQALFAEWRILADKLTVAEDAQRAAWRDWASGVHPTTGVFDQPSRPSVPLAFDRYPAAATR